MREFKFRVWDKLLNKFISWNSFISFDSRDYNIQQSTELNDKNGKLIFEGDLVQTVANHPTVFLKSDRIGVYTAGEVVWVNGGFRVCQKNVGSTEIHEYVSCDCCPCGLEVVGNIFENPELVK